MRCHYEVLEIEKTATDDEIKKAYRKLALKWHPDKNPDRLEECTQYFPIIQQAYEVLIDSQERAWYDRHRDAILKGGLDEHYKDNSLNLFPYFSIACYFGYGDDEKVICRTLTMSKDSLAVFRANAHINLLKELVRFSLEGDLKAIISNAVSFYYIYQHVFDTIAQEDADFMENTTISDIPRFGNANSSYNDIVGPFYAYWQSYSTSKPYTWLDKYDIQQAPNRRVVRLMEKDNAKIRLAAKKERNEEVRALVDFVRKRDKRVATYRKLLEDQRLEQKAKVESERLTQKLKNLKIAGEYKDADWHDIDAREDDLKEIESHFDDTCPRSNHVRSNQNQQSICPDNTAESSSHFADDINNSGNESDDYSDDDLYCVACEKMFKTRKTYENHQRSKRHKENVEVLKSIMAEEDIQLLGIDKQIRSKSNDNAHTLLNESESHNTEIVECSTGTDVIIEIVQQNVEDLTLDKDIDVKTKVKTRKSDIRPKKDELPKETRCKTCGELFDTRNKLFSHLEESGHATMKVQLSKHEKKNKKRR